MISRIETEGMAQTPLFHKSQAPAPGALIFSLPPAEARPGNTEQSPDSVSRESTAGKIPPQKEVKPDVGEGHVSQAADAEGALRASQSEPQQQATKEARPEESGGQTQRQHGGMSLRESVTQAREATAGASSLQEESLSDVVESAGSEKATAKPEEDQAQSIRKWLKGEWQKLRRQPLLAQQALMMPGGNQRSLLQRSGISFGMKAFAQQQAAEQGLAARRAPRNNQHSSGTVAFRLNPEAGARLQLSPVATTLHQPDSLSKEWMTLLERVQARVELLKAQQGGQQQLELESPLTGRLQLKLEAGELGWRLSIGVEKEVLLQELQKRSGELLHALQESGVLLEELNIDPEDARDQARHDGSGREDESQDETAGQGRFAAELNARLLFRGVRS